MKIPRIMKTILLLSTLLLLSAGVYLHTRFDLLAIAGLKSKGLPVKQTERSVSPSSADHEPIVDHLAWSALLSAHVDPEGGVDYQGLIGQRSALEAYLQLLAENAPAEDWPVQELLAYYINLYNARTAYLILEHYPVESIKDIKGAWTKEIVRIGDKKLSLSALEHSILRKMNEPRIHFAINCASASCPKLLNEAFRPDRLEQQLERVTREFINDPKHNRITEDTAELSKIFQWYRRDFKEGDLKAYINTYARTPVPEKARIRYRKYDWSLNAN